MTIFAPLNSAFTKLPEGTVETLLKPESKPTLAYILTNHVAPANYPIKQLKKEAKKGRKLYMASGQYLVVENKDDAIYVGGTKVLNLYSFSCILMVLIARVSKNMYVELINKKTFDPEDSKDAKNLFDDHAKLYFTKEE